MSFVTGGSSKGGSSGFTPITLTSAAVAIWINGKLFNQAQAISWSVDYSMREVWGIDGSYPQEISDGKIMIQGRISAIATAFDGWTTQKYNLRALSSDILQSPYSSIRIVNRANSDTLAYFENCRISNESVDAVVKKTVQYSFSFRALGFASGADLAYSNG